MAIKSSYTFVGLKYNTAIVPFRGVDVSFDIDAFTDGDANQTCKALIACLGEIRGRISIESSAVKDAYTALGDCLRITSAAPLTLYFAKRGETTYAAAGCATLLISNGVLALSGIRATHNQPASISYECTVESDGAGADPMILATGVALPADVLQTVFYTLGPLKVSSLIDIQSFDFRTGVKFMQEGASGDPYCTISAITGWDPSVDITTNDFAAVTNLTEIGKVAAPVLFLRKTGGASGRVAVGTAEHISISFAAAFCAPNSASGSWGQTSDIGLTLRPSYSSPTAMWVISSTAAIA